MIDTVYVLKQSSSSAGILSAADVIQIISIVIGALLILFQIQRNHRSSMRLQEHNIRNGILIDLFHELTAKMKEAQDAVIASQTCVQSLHGSISTYWALYDMRSSPPTFRIDDAQKLSQQRREFDERISDLLFVLEQFEIVSPMVRTFKQTICYQGIDSGGSFSTFYDFTTKFLPVAVQSDASERLVSSHPIVLTKPSEEDMKKIDQLAKDYVRHCCDMTAFLYDLSVELQNIFLGPLFNRTLGAREPVDPEAIVISSRPADLEKVKAFLVKHVTEARDQGRS